MKLKNANYKSYWNILVFCDQWKIISDLNIPHEKMSYLVFGLTVVINLRNFDFGSHWNTLIFLIKKDIVSQLNMSHGKMSGFISFLLFRFNLVIELEISMLKVTEILICFDKKNVRFNYVLSNSVWFCLSFVVWVKFWQ